MEMNAKDVMKLRNKTGLPMMDCKAALIEAKGDADKAEDSSARSSRARWTRDGPRRGRRPHRDRRSR
jgi:translation elongation factor EF-Ts